MRRGTHSISSRLSGRFSHGRGVGGSDATGEVEDASEPFFQEKNFLKGIVAMDEELLKAAGKVETAPVKSIKRAHGNK